MMDDVYSEMDGRKALTLVQARLINPEEVARAPVETLRQLCGCDSYCTADDRCRQCGMRMEPLGEDDGPAPHARYGH